MLNVIQSFSFYRHPRDHSIRGDCPTRVPFAVILMGALKGAVITLFVGGFSVLICNQAVAFWHARQNRKGETVFGFALYEKELPSLAIDGKAQTEITLPGSRVVKFYRHKIECELIRDVRQSHWSWQRKEFLKTQPKPIQAQLPVTRYQCGLFPMFYRAGIGWGVF